MSQAVLVLAVLRPLLVVVVVVGVVPVVVAAAARPTRRSTKAATMRAWLCLPLTRRYQTRSSSRASQRRRPCAATISSMDDRKSLYGSSDSTATATLSSTSDAGGSGSFSFSSSWNTAAAATGFVSGTAAAARMELVGGPGSKKKRSVEVRPEAADDRLRPLLRRGRRGEAVAVVVVVHHPAVVVVEAGVAVGGGVVEVDGVDRLVHLAGNPSRGSRRRRRRGARTAAAVAPG
ncbi:hypothetical protein OsJ_33024 [Oryza sativa Japonica Group]|uniref:Uncharacterized protein n=1 Tax=Oryza sativa subsp. japonica TaxID=39947 RepID=A3C8S9_ORYSJ|nr:hypothetical protein OsJ_33024 [Oryza sativa Japonica Group]